MSNRHEQEFYRGRLSINKDRKSPYWMVSFEGADGRRRRRSTKVPVAGGMFEGMRVSAKLAEKLAYQRGVQIACAAEEEYQSQNNVTVREWCEGVLGRRLGTASKDTERNARTAYKHFYSFLGRRADEPLRLVTKGDIKGFVLKRREAVRAATVRKDLAAIQQAFKDAADEDVIERNPCAGVMIPADKAGEKVLREAFTLDEVRYMLEHFPPAWSSAVRCCLETFGQRLGDVLRLDWKDFDWEKRVVTLTTGKTGRLLHQPMRDGFYLWAREKWERAGCPEQGLLHEGLLALGDGASAQFGMLLRSHGIGVVQAQGGGNRRRMNSKSFHSLRATAATMLQASGVAQGLAMELVGHESAAVHAVYIRPSMEQLRKAAEGLPELPL